jgi:Tfp pilus assembly protein PilX
MTSHSARKNAQRDSRGVALVTALLLLALFTVMTLSMVIATTSDTLIDGYYRNARASFYAADSGMNVIRQALLNDIYNNALPSGYKPSSGAPSLTITTTLPSDITSSSSGFGSYNSILGGSSSASQGSWASSFQLDTTTDGGSKIVSMVPATGNNPLCNPPATGAITTSITCTYNYSYHLVVDGKSLSGEQSVVEEYGVIPFSVNMDPTSSSTKNLAQWSTFFDQYALCSGAFVPGTMNGPMWSNQSWNYGPFSTGYIFGGNVSAVQSQVGYMYNDGTCDRSAAQSDTHSGTTIAPKFNGGLTVGANGGSPITLPTDSLSQLQAVLDGSGSTSPSNATMANVLKAADGTQWSTSATSGVFMPYTPGTPGPPATPSTFNTSGGSTSHVGGIYVQGNVDQMTLAASTSGTHKLQVITIKQGSAVTTVTLDLTGNTTDIKDNLGHDSGSISGLPTNVNTTPNAEGCMVYVTGNISSDPTANAPTGLSGPSSGPAIQDNSAVTITAGGAISITGNITYSTEPVSLNVSDTPVSPAPANVLGIYTNGGNVQFQPPSDVSSMQVDASFATVNGASGSAYGLTAVWNNIGTLNIVGGRVQNKALAGNSLGARNIYYDTRFSGNFAPPWFPTVTVTTVGANTATPLQPIANRTSWVNTSAQ